MRPILLLLALAGCNAFLNKDYTHEPAPRIDGGIWLSERPPAHEWRVVTFFATDGERSAGNVPRLKALAAEFGPKGVDVIAITRAPVEDARRFAEQHAADYTIQALGDAAFERWGVGDAEHAPIYVVDPNGIVLTSGHDNCVELLRERLGSAPEAPRK
ncbi:MAG TPA: redoxin domain-containing protein [Planctomycetota bacterium]|nr:redoxin domain-containing protein [Planctomycetota bacterium]